MSYRNLVGKVLRHRLATLDSINNSVDYYNDRLALRSAPNFQDRMQLYEHVAMPLADEPITFLEFGVWQGASFRKWLSLNRYPTSRFVGFDTFTGLPEDWTRQEPKGTFSTDGVVPQIDDARGSFVRGLFQDRLYEFLTYTPPEHRLIVHVDCDLYSSTLFVLTTLDRFFRAGSVLIFDDFHSLNHEYAAWKDYRRCFARKWRPLGMTSLGWQAAYELES